MTGKESLKRELKDASFEKVAIAIKGGMDNNAIVNPELLNTIVEGLKDKTVEDVLQIVTTCVLFLDLGELLATIKVIEGLVPLKKLESLQDLLSGDKGKHEALDAMLKNLEDEILNKESNF